MAKIAKKKAVINNEEIITDVISEEYIDENGNSKIKEKVMNGDKVIFIRVINA